MTKKQRTLFTMGAFVIGIVYGAVISGIVHTKE